MDKKLNELEWPENERPTLVHLKVSAEGQLEQAVAYLRTNARGFERAMALIEQQNALQRFADAAGYRVVRWFVEGENVELGGSVLDQLIDAVAADGRDFNAVLVWNYS